VTRKTKKNSNMSTENNYKKLTYVMFVPNIMMSWVLKLTCSSCFRCGVKNCTAVKKQQKKKCKQTLMMIILCYNEIFSFWQDLNNGCVCQSQCLALPFTLKKSILRQKKNYGNSNISSCKNNIIFPQKKSSKRNQNPSRY